MCSGCLGPQCQNLILIVDTDTPMAYNIIVNFQWDPAKNKSNIEKHGLSFEEAMELFGLPDDLVLEAYDFEHSFNEDRIISIGPIIRGIIVVVTVEHDSGETIRIISARFATTAEKRGYSEIVSGEINE